jgi:hypothetical protein
MLFLDDERKTISIFYIQRGTHSIAIILIDMNEPL